jgi:hypothetical protein
MSDTRLDSLDELINAIDLGLDIEFFLRGKRYNISTDGTPFIAVCPDGDGDYYQNGTDLVQHHLIDAQPLANLWKEIEIYAM